MQINTLHGNKNAKEREREIMHLVLLSSLTSSHTKQEEVVNLHAFMQN